MNSLRLKPALQYQLFNAGKVFLTTFGVLAAVHLFFAVISLITEGSSSVMFNGLSFVMIMMVFILGIVTLREDMKMLLQHGCGRHTLFCGSLLTSLITAVGLGLLCEAINQASIHIGGFNFIMDDFYHFMFPIRQAQISPLLGFLESWLLRITVFFMPWQLGTLVSLIYYRLNRNQQIIFSVLAGGLLFFGLPYLASAMNGFGQVILNFFEWAMETPYRPMLLLLLAALVCALGNYLLLRRAQVKE